MGRLCFGCLLDPSLIGEEEGATPPTTVCVQDHADGRFAHYALATHPDGSFVELGRGAMGITYRATDTILRCDVALKVVAPEIVGNARTRARFLREAQAAAGLRHPHVASVFFFGERPSDGQPFYAMELVEGETLQARVRRVGGLPADTVLEIGAQVADALAAAEARGLTHRDLKPANLMLVDGEGINVKVIDFGLAKAAVEKTAGDPSLTQAADFIGTPAFASPEHFNTWQDIDARSDFYALGATLWYALTGHAPFAGRTLADIHERQLAGALPLDRLRAAQVPAPVTALLTSLLSPDPAGRPQTATELAAALADCKQTDAGRRGGGPRKVLSWRRRELVAVVGALALGAGVLILLQHRTGDLARQNSQFQQQTLVQQQQLGAMQIQLQQQTQLIALISERMDRRASAQGTGRAPGNPAAVRAEVARERGVSIETLQKQLEDEQADVHLLLAQIDRRLTDAQAQTAQWQRLKRDALARSGAGEYAAGHYLAAIESYQQALALTDPDKESMVWCNAARNLAHVCRLSARYAEAASLLQQVVDRQSALQGPESPATLKAKSDQASLLCNQGHFVEAETLYRPVLAAQERTLGPENPDTLRTLRELAYLLHYRGNDAEAEVLGRRCLEAGERTLGKESLDTLYIANQLAITLTYQGNFTEAAILYRRCLEARERLLGPDHPDTIDSLNNLAIILQQEGDLAGSEALYRRALAAQERAMGPDHPSTLTIANNLGNLLVDEKNYPAAEMYTRRALEGRTRVLGPDHTDALTSLSNLAQLLDARGDAAAAAPIYEQAQRSMERLLSPTDTARLDLEHYFSLFREKQGRLPEALALARQAADACRALPEASPLRHTYEQHFRDLQTKVAAASSSPEPTRVSTTR